MKQDSTHDKLEFRIHGQELIRLYLLLNSREEFLDQALLRLRERLEDNLYEALSIEEMEQLTSRYDGS